MYALLDSGNTTSGKVQDLVSIPVGGTLADAKGITAAQQALCVPIPVGLPVGVGWSYSNGTFSPPAPSNVTPPTLAQQAAAAIAAGLTITLSGTMTLAATLFPTDPATTAKIIAVVTAINTDGTFPGGATTFPMKDSAGTWHTFTSSQYKSVASALAAYVAALNLIIDGNPLDATSLPANAVTLTV